MKKRKNLWNDVDALARLARSGETAERESSGADPVRLPDPASRYPHFPDRDDFDVHASSTAARGVAGDFFDFFFVSDETLAVTVADISGKGVPAAVLMSVTRSMVRNLSSVSCSPAETLTRVNDILRSAELGAMYLTIFLGWYDTRSGRLCYANAGHPRPFRIHGTRGVEPFGDVTGSILGILDVDRYEDREEQLGAGDRLVLYTDGVTEARSPEGEFFGDARLAGLLEQHRGVAVDRLCQEVIRDVTAYQGEQRDDDATVLVLEHRPRG